MVQVEFQVRCCRSHPSPTLLIAYKLSTDHDRCPSSSFSLSSSTSLLFVTVAMRVVASRIAPRAFALCSRNMSSAPSSSSSAFPTPEPLPLSQPTPEQETKEFEARTSRMASFFSLPRFSKIKRPYTPEAVASKQGSLPVTPLPSNYTADKLFSLLSKAAEDGKPVSTMGAIDPVQMSQMVYNQDAVYVSGWACSSVLTTGNNEVGPDFGYAATSFCVFA